MKRLTIVVCTFLFFISVAAANNSPKYYEGSVTLEGGEVLTGNIELLSPTLNEVKVKFISASGEVQVFKAKDVLSYNFLFPVLNPTTQTYENRVIEYAKRTFDVAPISFTSPTALAEITVKGKFNLFTYYIENPNTTKTHAFECRHYIEVENTLHELTHDNYIARLQQFFADYPELQQKVGTDNHKFQDLAEMMRLYNAHFHLSPEISKN